MSRYDDELLILRDAGFKPVAIAKMMREKHQLSEDFMHRKSVCSRLLYIRRKSETMEGSTSSPTSPDGVRVGMPFSTTGLSQSEDGKFLVS